MTDDEGPLSGGNMNSGVVRVGVPGAPRPLGLDDHPRGARHPDELGLFNRLPSVRNDEIADDGARSAGSNRPRK